VRTLTDKEKEKYTDKNFGYEIEDIEDYEEF
jgi:hypothetical protein